MRKFTLTHQEFANALKRAQEHDQSCTVCCNVQFLLDHAFIRESDVLLIIAGNDAPRPPAFHS